MPRSEEVKEQEATTVADIGKNIEVFFSRLFYLHGKLVGLYPSYFLIGSLVFTAICVCGIPYLKIDLDLYNLFVPIGAPVRTEYERSFAYADLPGVLKTTVNETVTKRTADDQKVDIVRFYVVHKDYKNLLESELLTRLFNYSREADHVTNRYQNKTYTLADFCLKDEDEKCVNLNIWLKHAGILFSEGGAKTNPNLQLSYPVMYLFNRPKDIGQVVYGVNVSGEKHEIIGAKVLTLHWPVKFPNTGLMNGAYNSFREALNAFWQSKSKNSGINFIPHNDRAMDDEMRHIILTALPFAIPVSLTLMLFVILSNFSTIRTESKPVEAFLAVISVILSLICTFGIAFRCGMTFNPVSCTMPFLVLAVGVDDAFLLLGAWRTTKKSLPVEERMALTMADAGVSITVTSATNFGCFALGYFLCATPAVASFCLLTAFGVMMDYAFQITFYSAIMIYGGRKETSGGLVTCCYNNEKSDNTPKESNKTESDEFIVPFMHRLFGHYYAPFILRKDVKIISWILFLLYFSLGVYGCATITVDISPKKYIRDNSPIQTFIHLADKFIWADNVMPTFYVMRPPDLRDPTARARVNELIYRLEHTEYSIGRISTNFWMWEYQRFLNDYPGVNLDRDFYEAKYLVDFLLQPDYEQYTGHVKIDRNISDGKPNLVAFRFQTSFYGLDSWDKRQSELFRWRRILADYSDLDVFLSDIFTPFLIDQRKTIAPSSMQSIGSAISVMAIISTFFLPDMQSVLFMTWSLLSISMGVCGGLSLWGSELDSVSTGCIVMAIGLAVDFSVHICYRYHRSNKKTGEEKVYDTLTVVGWPVLQAGLSTLIGLMSLPFIPAYLIRVFYQTVVLVNVIGLTHALLWLPQLISSLDPCDRIPMKLRYTFKQ